MKKAIRITNWNILDGGTGRADPLAEVVLAGKPDVVVLTEASDPAVVARLAWRLRMEALTAVGVGSAVAILLRGDVVWSVNRRLVSGAGPRAWVEAGVSVGEAGARQVLRVIAVHFSAGATAEDETRRLEELRPVLEATEALRAGGVPHVLVGDFNANSPMQEIDLARVKEKTRKAAEGQGGTLSRDVVSAILAAGYVDSLAATRPEVARTGATFTTKDPGQRVDYVFGFNVAFSDGWIETDRLAQFASDHFPIGAELTVGG